MEQKIAEATKRILDLKGRATKVNFKNVVPRLPKKAPTESTLRGLEYRLGNYEDKLEVMEKTEAQTKKV